GGEIDLRQRGYRQPEIAEQAAKHHRDPEQRGRDRAVDEGRRHAHGLTTGAGTAAVGVRFPFSCPRGVRVPSGACRGPGVIWPASSALETVTCVPSVRRPKPVVTTRSSACRPVATTACTSSCWVSRTRRTVTLLSSLST